MSESVEYKVNKAILNSKPGKLFFPNNFNEFGSTTAVRQALNRLEKKGVLVRLAHGIYLYPKKHKTLGVLLPSIEEIARAIAKRDKARIIPTGINALNKLGLSTQVPMNTVYLTDGTPRVVKVGKRTIKFKIASPKMLSAKSEIMVLIIMAMRELGQDRIDDDILKKITPLLKQIDTNIIKHDIKLAPAWIREIIEKL